jgi:hypothetical protein
MLEGGGMERDKVGTVVEGERLKVDGEVWEYK